VTSPRTSSAREEGGGLGVAADELRRHNLALLLDRLHLSGPLSRSELTAITGLNRSTIADLIGELTALGLTQEGPGLVASGPGRPSPVVRTRPEGAVVLAVELGVDSFAVATVGIGGHVFNSLRVARPRARFSPQQTLQDVSKLAGPLLDALPPGNVLCGVGVAVVGITRRADGFVHFAPNLGWHDVPLAELLASQLGIDVPVLVANDADLGALAEHQRGAGTGADHLIYIGGEMGIGIGVIIDGEPMLGANGYAGEAGHMLINPAGVRCRCGSIGCWESEAGEAALLRRCSVSRSTGLRAMEAVGTLAEAGDEAVLAALAETGRWLGLGVANLVNIFNPELVVLGGLYHRFFPYLEATVTSTVADRALEMAAARVTIRSSQLGDDAPLVGAAELALSGVIADPGRSTAGRATLRRRPRAADRP
jgi:predicted NBD/HSP70 family sugar kinase